MTFTTHKNLPKRSSVFWALLRSRSSLLRNALIFVVGVLALWLYVSGIRSNLNSSVTEFSSGFENTAGLNDLLSRYKGKWSRFQIEGSDHNFVEVQEINVHYGSQALRCFATPTRRQGQARGKVSKADIQKDGMSFRAGQHFWFSGWFFIEGDANTKNLFIFDVESSLAPNNAGRRLLLSGSGSEIMLNSKGAGLNLKQSRRAKVVMPKNQWVHLVVHLYLAHDETGLAEVWQDDLKIIEGRGPNLPPGQARYNNFSVGITANGSKTPQTVYVDDVVVSRQALR